MKCARGVSLILLFLILAFCSVGADPVYDQNGEPLRTNTLYLVAHYDDDYWRHGVSFTHSEEGIFNLQSILPLVQTGSPDYSFGFPVTFHSADPASSQPPTINITTETPLTISFISGFFRWFVDERDSSRFVKSEVQIHEPSFFIKKDPAASGSYNAYNIAYLGDQYVKVADSNGVKRLVATEGKADAQPLGVHFSRLECPDVDYRSVHSLAITPQMMHLLNSKEASKFSI